MATYTGLEIAVIGMSGRFPQAGNIEEFWENIREGRESVEFVSREELLASGVPESVADSGTYIGIRNALKDKAFFDAAFFDIRPVEAAVMDPQMRIFHECVWEALESAGYNPFTYPDKIGLFAGASSNILWEVNTIVNRSQYVDDFSASFLRDARFLPSKIAYLFNLRGPAVYVHSACSTSLLAIYQACNSLLLGECSIALAGGVAVPGETRLGYTYQEGMILSADGHCRTFDAAATGTIGGEGAGVVVLKKLEDALRDNDPILAIIKGGGMNNDGREKVGYTAPGVDGQARAILMALQMADIPSESVGYIEAHGTATKLGDVIEIEALKRAYSDRRQYKCALGSVKANIGHLDAAAGIAGFIKTVMAIQHRQLPPAINYTSPNPELHLENSLFYVNTELKPWNNHGFPLRAGVSSFGIGGTNVHIILEEAPAQAFVNADQQPQLLVVSARTPVALENNLQRLHHFLVRHPHISLADVSYTLQVGRKHFPYRETLVINSIQDAVSRLEERLVHPAPPPASHEIPQKVFMFTGQGSQYTGMCSRLYEEDAFFREEVDKCLQIAARHSLLDFKQVLFVATGNSPYTINDTICAQPVLFIVEYALCRLLMKWGITPDLMIGHSIGEYVAACVAGVFSLEDALRLVIRRGELMQQTTPGAMLGVSVEQDKLQQLLKNRPELSIASENSATAFVVSGTLEAIREFADTLEKEKIICQRLQVSHAFHSALMDEVLPSFQDAVAAVVIHPPAMRYISSYTGKEADYRLIREPSYWAHQLRHTVKFADGIGTLLQLKQPVFIEVGAGNVLSTLVQQHSLYTQRVNTSCLLPHPREKAGGRSFLLNKIGQLWKAGIVPAWESMYAPQTGRRIALPSYAFEKVKYPVKISLDKVMSGQWQTEKQGEKSNMDNWFYAPVWEQQPIHFLSAYNNRKTKDTCIFFISDNPLCHQVKVCQQQAGTRVISVMPGKSFARLDDDIYCINAGAPEDYIQLLKTLQVNQVTADSILHAWQLTTGDVPDLTLQAVEAAQITGLYSLLYIAQAIGTLQISYPVQVDVLTNHLQEVMRGELKQPQKATMLGALKVIPLEYHNISCRNIDVVAPLPGTPEESGLAEKIVEETQAPTPDIQVAYRGDMRWTPSFRQVTLPESKKHSLLLKNKGVYLITGGMGGMGFTLAEHLGLTFSATLILIVRSAFPNRGQWEEWKATHEENNEISKKIRRLEAMEAKGAAIYLYTADVSDAVAMAAIINEVLATCGNINGIIHAAGVIDYGGIIQRRNKAAVESVMAPKVQAPVLMYELIKVLPIDFFIVFSSIGNALYGGKFGQIGYNASNEFLDAFAIYMQQHVPFYTASINWCDWQDIGMSVKAIHHQEEEEEALKDKLLRLKKTGITPAEGIRVFESVLFSGVSRIIISPTDLSEDLRRMTAYLAGRSQYLEEVLLMQNGEVKNARPALASDYEAPLSKTEITLSRIWSNFFGFDKIGIRDNFFELGGDSLKALKLLSMMKQELKRDIPLAGLFEMPVIAELGTWFDRNEEPQEQLILVPAEKKFYYELASAQKRILFLHGMDHTSLAYNMPNAVLLKGLLDKEKIQNTLMKVIRLHESLRTSFVIHEHEYVQRITEDITFELEYFTCTDAGNVRQVMEGFIRPFDIGKAPLFRACIIALHPDESLLVVDAHHAIFDGASQSVLINDFMALYSGAPLSPQELQFKDYTTWQSKYERSREMEIKRQFWQEEFAQPVPVIDLPADWKRPAVKGYEGAVYACTIEEPVISGIRELAAKEGVTTFAFLFAVYNILLARLANLEDIVVGTATSGRAHKEMQQVIGMFVNTMPVRNHPAGGLSFSAFLQQVKNKMTAFLKHQDYAYEHLLREHNIRNDGIRNPFFDTIFNYSKGVDNVLEIPGLAISRYDISTQISKMDLVLTVMETDKALHFSYEYYSKLFRPERIAHMAVYFDRIVAVVLQNPQIRIADIALLAPEEKTRLLNSFSPEINHASTQLNILQRLDQIAARYPDSVAAITETNTFTYQQLLLQINGNARQLLQQGVQPKEVVALCCNDGFTFFISLMAILRAGAVAMPMAVADNVAYVARCCEVTGVRMMVADQKTDTFSPVKIVAICQDNIFPAFNGHFIFPENEAGDTAWITWRYDEQHQHVPVKLSHGAIACTLDFLQRRYPVKPGDIVLQTNEMDLSLLRYEQCWNILYGATVCCRGVETTGTSSLAHIISQYGITQLQLNNKQLTALITGNDTVMAGLHRIFMKDDMVAVQELLTTHLPRLPYINCSFIYGYPQEGNNAILHNISVDAAARQICSTPFSEQHLVVMDQYNNLQAMELEGELGWLITGELIGKPLAVQGTGSQVFKTGERVKWLQDGKMVLIDQRRDIGILNGQTICFTDISHCLSSLDGVIAAAAFCITGDTTPYLCGLLVCREVIDLQHVYEQLKCLLPAHMLPTYYVIVDILPDKKNAINLFEYIAAHQIATLRITAISCDSDLSVSGLSLMENEMNF